MKKSEAFDILGVNKKSSLSEVKKNFRILARRYHPDLASDKKLANTRFAKINEAYQMIISSHKFSSYEKAVNTIQTSAKITSFECIDLILNIAKEIAKKENIFLKLTKSRLKTRYLTGYYVLRYTSFRYFWEVIKTVYIDKYGIEKYNHFLNEYFYVLDNKIKDFKNNKDSKSQFFYNHFKKQLKKYWTFSEKYSFLDIYNVTDSIHIPINKIKNNISNSSTTLLNAKNHFKIKNIKYIVIKYIIIKTRHKIRNIKYGIIKSKGKIKKMTKWFIEFLK